MFSADPLVIRMRGQQLTLPHLHQNGFDHPIMIEDKEGLEMTVPPSEFTVTDIGNLVGKEFDFVFWFWPCILFLIYLVHTFSVFEGKFANNNNK